ncbi:hypothetical protein EJ02DRAFT_470488 [Clathrospora elynae]|uniref:DUF7730 domain-containing protein n=1 Tax=Clathrospora elynae TaxID=706981 RepID=A0A6A5S9S5_9PLEO|nr:hypothetical protein EJ02DRAFT_470488 [Clathrospora elynae]
MNAEMRSLQESKLKSRLLQLPGELRNKIYAYLFHDRIWHIQDNRALPAAHCDELYHCTRPKSILYKPELHRNPLALLRVNRQIYYETRSLPYSQSEFYLHDKPTFDTWIFSRQQFQLDCIHTLQLRCNMFVTLGWTGGEIAGATWPLDGHVHDERLLALRLPSLEQVHVHVRVFAQRDVTKGFPTKASREEQVEYARERMGWTDLARTSDDVWGYVQLTAHGVPEML